MTTIHGSLDIYDALEEDVRQIIFAEVNAVEPGRLTLNRNLWRGPVVPANDRAQNHEGVWVMLSAGNPSVAYLGANGTEHRPGIQIRIRAGLDAGAYQRGAKLARQCFLAVDQFPPPAFEADGVTPIVPLYVPTTRICDLRSRSSHPLSLGKDEDGHHEWSINVDAVIDGHF